MNKEAAELAETKTDMSSVTFIVNNDQPLVVVGDITILGDWNPSRGTIMNNDPLGSPQWVCSVWLTRITGNIQFKFVQKRNSDNKINGHGIDYCWEDVPNRVASVEANTQTLIVGAFGQRDYTVQSNQLPPQINISPSGGLCKLILPFWVHNIESILELHMQDKTLQGVIDLQNGLVVATESLKIEQLEAETSIYWTLTEKGRTVTSQTSSQIIKAGTVVWTYWSDKVKGVKLDGNTDEGEAVLIEEQTGGRENAVIEEQNAHEEQKSTEDNFDHDEKEKVNVENVDKKEENKERHVDDNKENGVNEEDDSDDKDSDVKEDVYDLYEEKEKEVNGDNMDDKEEEEVSVEDDEEEDLFEASLDDDDDNNNEDDMKEKTVDEKKEDENEKQLVGDKEDQADNEDKEVNHLHSDYHKTGKVFEKAMGDFTEVKMYMEEDKQNLDLVKIEEYCVNDEAAPSKKHGHYCRLKKWFKRVFFKQN